MSTILALIAFLSLIPLVFFLVRAIIREELGEKAEQRRIWKCLRFSMYLALLLGLIWISAFYLSEYWFFESLGQSSVYLTTLAWKGSTFFIAAVLTYALFYWSVIRLFHSAQHIGWQGKEGSGWLEFWTAVSTRANLLISIAVGLNVARYWQDFVNCFKMPVSGVVDPIFGMDTSFFLGTLPFLNGLVTYFLYVFLISLMGRLCVLWILSELPDCEDSFQGRKRLYDSGFRQRTILRSFVALLLLLVAFLIVSRYMTVYSEMGKVYGVSAVDVYALMPGLAVGAVLAFVLAVYLYVRSLGRMDNGRSVWTLSGTFVVLLVSCVFVYPLLYQTLRVNPKRFEMEKTYVENNIRATQYAFGVSSYTDRPLVPQSITQADLALSRSTLENVRLLDVRLVDEYFGKFQGIRPLYDFLDVDVVRLVLEGKPRLALLSGREINPERLTLNDRTWESIHLRYTHGYGLCMAMGHELDSHGYPILRIKDVPPVSSIPSLKVLTPEIYFGEGNSSYVVVNTELPEYHYPEGEGNKFNHYDGTGGVPVGGFFSKLVYSLRFDDVNILLSGYLTEGSRVLWHQNVSELVETLAPWLVQDSDPYQLIGEDGALYYVIDGYTQSSWYPNSTPKDKSGVNYMRNTVKITVDAKNGRPVFWVTDTKEPLLATWMKTFPGLFKEISNLPQSLKKQLRYPEELFGAQVHVLNSYHFSPDQEGDVQNFFVGEDRWQIPHEVYMDARGDMKAYYTVMQLPGNSEAEGMLIQPVTPLNRDNLIAWIGARMDGDNYGKLVVFRFPKNSTIAGPMMVEGAINANKRMQSELGILKRGGSNVMRANMIVLPVGQGLLYVKPLYLRSESAGLSELLRVVVSDGTNIGWGANLAEGLSDMLGLAPSSSMAERPMAESKAGAEDTSNARRLLKAYLTSLGNGQAVSAGESLKDLIELLGVNAGQETEVNTPYPTTD